MSCPFSVSKSEIYNSIGCYRAEEKQIKCPFSNECNNSQIWDSLSSYISKGIRTYEEAMDLKEQE